MVPATAATTLDGLPAEHAGGRTSRQVTAPMPFSMVGFEVPDGATAEFRTSVDGTAWTPWTEVEVEPKEGPDPSSAEGKSAIRHMSEPVWVGEASRIQTRLRGGRPATSADDLGVHLIDSSGLGRSLGQRVLDRLKAAWRGTPPAAEATVDRPTIITRSQWGADESLRRYGPSYASKIRLGVVHHTAGANGYSRSESDDVVRGVYRYHVQSRGWSDIGYNFLVDRYGRLYEGRYGGITKPVIGAHAGGFNSESFGVSLMGSFDGARPPKAMRRALRHLLAWKFDYHHVNVLGSTDYTTPDGSSKFGAGQTVRLRRLSGHRNVSLTSCPGGQTYEMLPRLRKQVAELQGPVIYNPSASPSTVRIVDGRSVSGAITFAARLRPAGVGTVTITKADGTFVWAGVAPTSSTRFEHQWIPNNVQPGSYRYTISSPGRRSATGRLYLRAPDITAAASSSSATIGADGLLKKPVSFTGTLWKGAEWHLRITNGNGYREVITDTGKNLTAQWDGPLNAKGTYTWRVRADGATPVTGQIRVGADRVQRTAKADDPAAAAAAISRRAFTDGAAQWAVLTPRNSPNVALAAGALAGRGGPVLYTDRDSVPEATTAELQRVLPAGGKIYVLGDATYISQTVLDTLAATWTLEPVPGSTPQDIAAAAAGKVRDRQVLTGATTSTVVLSGTTGAAWTQGVAGPTYAARRGYRLLLTPSAALAPVASDYLSNPANGIDNVVIVGNSTAVSAAVRDALPDAVTVIRVGGDTPALTAVRVARRLFGRTDAVANHSWQFANLSRTDSWVRTLAGAPLGARTNAPLLGAGGSGVVPAATKRYLGNLDYTASVLGRGVVLGDRHHISGDVRTALARHLQ